MKKTKKYIKNTVLTLLITLLVLSPFVFVFSTVVFLPPQFESDFEAALGKKYDRLNSIEGEKIVVVGGSSVAFGLDSEMLEKYAEKPVVNFGLYAALGTKLMLDLSLSGIGEGDTVVLAPELDEQTLSMYFSAHHTLIALESSPEILRFIPKENKYSLLGGIWKFSAEKIRRLLDGTPEPEGVYNSKNINEYGDIEYQRAENVMERYYNPAKPIKLSPQIAAPDFLDYINDYIRECESRGAHVVFTYPPMNSLAISPEHDPYEFEKFLIDNLECDVISFIDDYILDPGYFYDTDFHLNDTGVVLRTRQLAIDLGYSEATAQEKPDAPPLPEKDTLFDGYDENEKYFIYETAQNGAKEIVGLTDEGKAKETLTIPTGAEGYKVTTLNTSAFDGSSVKKIIVTEDTNLRQLTGDGFGASNVSDIYFYYDWGGDDGKAVAPIEDLSHVTIHVKTGVYWPTSYLWNGVNAKFVYDLD